MVGRVSSSPYRKVVAQRCLVCPTYILRLAGGVGGDAVKKMGFFFALTAYRYLDLFVR